MTGNTNRRIRIKAHIRHRVTGTALRPRMTVFRSNTQIYVLLIDDVTGVTKASASSQGDKDKATKIEQAAKVGTLVAKAAKEAEKAKKAEEKAALKASKDAAKAAETTPAA